MNERIYDLALEVLKDYPTLESWTFTRTELGEFAHLIVKECCQMMMDLEVKYPANLTVLEIKKYFGVKE